MQGWREVKDEQGGRELTTWVDNSSKVCFFFFFSPSEKQLRNWDMAVAEGDGETKRIFFKYGRC